MGCKNSNLRRMVSMLPLINILLFSGFYNNLDFALNGLF